MRNSAKRHDPEHQIQRAFIEIITLHERMIPGLRLSFAVPNGGSRHPAVAAKLKAEGVRRHIPDWMLPVPNCFHIGLAIEFKAPGKYPNRGQRDMHEALQECGWDVQVFRDAEKAWLHVRDYFGAVRPAIKRGINTNLGKACSGKA